MAQAHAFVADLALWANQIENRPESTVLRAALREYQFAIVGLAFGQYRAAFGALRLSLELSLSAVQWSANERELREWKRGQRDTNWTALIDSDSGVLSKQFVRLFSEPLADEAPVYRATAATLYRECSEFVHGNVATVSTLPDRLSFTSTTFEAWHQKASSMRLVTSFALAARYLSDLGAAAPAQLEAMLLDHLGHSTGVRILLGAAVEDSHA